MSTLRKELAALRVLARKARHPDLALALELPVWEPPPPETITDEEYERALRMPDRTHAGRRDYAILLVLGETGVRNAELRALTGADLVRRRRDSPTRALRVHGKGGRVLALPRRADQALEEWLRVHPLAHRSGEARVLPEEAPLLPPWVATAAVAAERCPAAPWKSWSASTCPPPALPSSAPTRMCCAPPHAAGPPRRPPQRHPTALRPCRCPHPGHPLPRLDRRRPRRTRRAPEPSRCW